MAHKTGSRRVARLALVAAAVIAAGGLALYVSERASDNNPAASATPTAAADGAREAQKTVGQANPARAQRGRRMGGMEGRASRAPLRRRRGGLVYRDAARAYGVGVGLAVLPLV